MPTTAARSAVVAIAVLLGIGLLAPAASALKPERDPAPLARAHAHNDYEHLRPLQDALTQGFTSVEADVWLVDGALLVGHDQTDLKPKRTLASLYLDPLVKRIKSRGGSVFRTWAGPFQLLIDVKSDAATTYKAIHAELRAHRRIMTTFTGDSVDQGAVTAVISGSRDLALMQAQPKRFAGYDGRVADLDSGISPTVMPLVSDNWLGQFTWWGMGPMPEDQRAKLHDIVDRAHAAGYRVRFWGTTDVRTPARRALWKELLAADVDQINTDDLPALAKFLRKHDS